MGINTGQQFVAARGLLLTVPFDPNAGGYQAPTGSPLSDPYARDLATAWEAAATDFRNLLCGLKAVFINPCAATMCTDSEVLASWGYRERPSQVGNQGPFNKYIALSAGIWSGSNPRSLDDYENRINNSIVGWKRFRFNTANANFGSQSVLAALAHEYGHVLLYEKHKADSNGNFDYTKFCPSGFNQTWTNRAAPPNFRKFGRIDPNSQHAPIADSAGDSIAELLSDTINDDVASALPILRNLLTGDAGWASLFSAFSPDEDVVESFVFYVLISSTKPVTSFKLTVLGADGVNYADVGDVYGEYGAGTKKVLAKKIKCF
jgi:hypothetical protein